MQVLKLQQQRQQKNALGVVTLFSLIFQGANLFLLLLLTGAYFGLKDKAPPSLVQMEAGRSIAVEPMDSRQRTPAVIQEFVRNQMSMLLSASGRVPVQEGGNPSATDALDPGVEIAIDGGRAKIPTLAHMAAFGLSESFRSAFLRDLAKRTPQDVFGNGGRQRVLIVQDVSVPEPIGNGQWKVTLISSLVDFEAGDLVGLPRPFNKEIFVQSVPPPRIEVYSEYASGLDRKIAEVRKSGLEIYAIRNYVRGDIRPSNFIDSGNQPGNKPEIQE